MSLEHVKDIFKKGVDLFQDILNIIRKVSHFTSEATILSVVAGLAVLLNLIEAIDAVRMLRKEIALEEAQRDKKRIFAHALILLLALAGIALSITTIVLLLTAPATAGIGLLLPFVYTCLVSIFLIKYIHKNYEYTNEPKNSEKKNHLKKLSEHAFVEFLAGISLCAGMFFAADLFAFSNITSVAVALILVGVASALINEIVKYCRTKKYHAEDSDETSNICYESGAGAVYYDPQIGVQETVSRTENPDELEDSSKTPSSPPYSPPADLSPPPSSDPSSFQP